MRITEQGIHLMDVQILEQKIGDAWQAHRAGNQAQSVELFEQVLNDLEQLTDADLKISKIRLEADAHYGLGLALRARGNRDAAIRSFQAAHQLCQERYQKLASHPDSQTYSNNLGTMEDDRYMMLLVMIGQRLRELGASVPD
ncbi:MAG: tetratricopeptide repeat protein [Anaerolineae bacterium]|nr:tetratricopeptide repeat protein [Anaerolineae bacterium]MDW8173079.1 tetratricopeptide repeat protein [Anaerolineae bacterium]